MPLAPGSRASLRSATEAPDMPWWHSLPQEISCWLIVQNKNIPLKSIWDIKVKQEAAVRWSEHLFSPPLAVKLHQVFHGLSIYQTATFGLPHETQPSEFEQHPKDWARPVPGGWTSFGTWTMCGVIDDIWDMKINQMIFDVQLTSGEQQGTLRSKTPSRTPWPSWCRFRDGWSLLPAGNHRITAEAPHPNLEAARCGVSLDSSKRQRHRKAVLGSISTSLGCLTRGVPLNILLLGEYPPSW